MIRIAIVEDDRHDREALKKCLNRYEKENQVKFSVTEFQDGEDIVTDYTASYDLIILDIEMAFLNGMKAAEKIRELDTNVIIIFITNMPQYAIQGYKVNALDYILKPISYFSFSESMVRALAKVKTPEKEYITIVLKGGKKKLDVARICYVEVQDHVLIYHTLDGDFETKGTMRDTDNQFDPKKYFRCNRCYLVNLEFVETYQGSDIMVNGDTIQVSRSRRKPFLDALNEYMNEHVYMYSSENAFVKFRIVKAMISDVIDLFGKGVNFSEETDTHVSVSVHVNERAAEQFAKNYAPDVVILQPKRLRDKLRDDLKKAWEAYED